MKLFSCCLFSLLFLPTILSAADDNPALPVRVVEAVQVQFFPRTWLPATVIGRYDSKIAAEVDGRLETVLDVGARVSEGEQLASIESFTHDLYVEEMQAGILPLEARVEYLQREVERLSKLAEQNNAAKNRLDEVTSQFRETQGQIKMAKVRLAQARDRLARTLIYAPFDGVVTERYKSEGERVQSGDEVLRLVNTGDLEIKVRVPLEAIANISENDEFEVKDNDFSSMAHLRTYVPVGDDLSRLYELRLSFVQPEWMAGHAVRASIPVSRPKLVVAVPRDALVIRQNNISVFRINSDNVAEYVAVSTGLGEADLIEIIGEVSAGERIVIRGNERLRPGQRVSIQVDDNPQ